MSDPKTDPKAATPAVTESKSTALMTQADAAAELALGQYLELGETEEPADANEIATEIVKRILQANSVDDVLKKQQLIGCQSLVNVPLQIRGFRIASSTFEDSSEGFYFVVDAVQKADGSILTIACGSRNCMAQLYRLRQLNAIPCDLQFGKSNRATAKGYFPMWLEPIPADF